MMKRPEFKSGNKWMVEALNLVAEYAQRTGVNPGGRPGWSETAQGWLPPKVGAGGGGVFSQAWPLTVVDGEAAEVSIGVGTILKGADSITQKLTISNPTEVFTVSSGGYIALKIASEVPTSCQLVFLAEWPEESGYQVTYTGTMTDGDFVFTARHFPLWKFIPTATDSSLRVSESIHAEQLCFNHLEIQYGIYRTPDGEFVQLPGFSTSHKAA
jgi:hypothetical protein